MSTKSEKITQLQNEITELKEKRREREASIPAHSIRAHQMMELEEMEEQIEQKESELSRRLQEEE